MHCEPLVIREAAQETGLGAGLNHLQFVVTHILSFEALDFLVDAVSHFLRRVAGEWNSVKSEEVRVLVAGKTAEASRRCRDLFITYQRPVEARGAAVGHDIGDGVVNRVIFAHIVGAMIALEINGLRGIRSEERRVGKECRGRWSAERGTTTGSVG